MLKKRIAAILSLMLALAAVGGWGCAIGKKEILLGAQNRQIKKSHLDYALRVGDWRFIGEFLLLNMSPSKISPQATTLFKSRPKVPAMRVRGNPVRPAGIARPELPPGFWFEPLPDWIVAKVGDKDNFKKPTAWKDYSLQPGTAMVVRPYVDKNQKMIFDHTTGRLLVTAHMVQACGNPVRPFCFWAAPPHPAAVKLPVGYIRSSHFVYTDKIDTLQIKRGVSVIFGVLLAASYNSVDTGSAPSNDCPSCNKPRPQPAPTPKPPPPASPASSPAPPSPPAITCPPGGPAPRPGP